MKRLLRALVILPVLAFLFMLGASPAEAADLRQGDTVIIASGDVVNDDLYIAANRITIDGTVNGDVIAVGETVIVNGKVNGSVMALGSTVNIGGEVTHAVRIGGANLSIGGSVGGDVVVAGDSVQLAGAAKIGRDLLFAARSVNADNPTGRSIMGYAQKLELSNIVTGDVEVTVTNLTIDSTAKIQGNLTYVSDNDALIRNGAQIAGTTTHNLPEPRKPASRSSRIWAGIIAFLMTIVTGSVIILVAPKRAAAVAETLERKPWYSLGWGAVILFAAPLAILIVLITIIGVPVGLIGLVLYGLAIYLAQIAVGLFIGRLILSRAGNGTSRGMLIGAFALGFLILTLVKLIPFIGFPVWLATVLFGMGAMALSLRKAPPEAMAAATVTPAA